MVGQGRGNSITTLEVIDPESPLDAVLLIRRTGVLVEGWTKSGASHEVLTVMAATMFGSVLTLVEALGDASPSSVIVETDERRILATKVGAQDALVLVAPKSVGDGFLKQSARKMLRRELPGVMRERTSRTTIEVNQ